MNDLKEGGTTTGPPNQPAGMTKVEQQEEEDAVVDKYLDHVLEEKSHGFPTVGFRSLGERVQHPHNSQNGSGGNTTSPPNQPIGMTKEEKDAVEKYLDQLLEQKKKGNENEVINEEENKVAKVQPPSRPSPLMTKFSCIQKQIQQLMKAAVMTPVVAHQVQLVVQEIPYLSARLKEEIVIAATHYELAFVAHASFREGGASTLEDDLEVSEIKRRISTLETEKSKLESEDSALEAMRLALEDEKASLKAKEARLELEESKVKQKRSAEEIVLKHEILILEREISSLKADEAALDRERSALDSERYAMEEDSQQEAKPFTALENGKEVQALRTAAAAAPYANEKAMSAREKALSVREIALARTVSGKKDVLVAKKDQLFNTSAASAALKDELTAKKNKLGTRKDELATKKDELATKKDQLATSAIALERALSAKKVEMATSAITLERTLSDNAIALKDAFVRLNGYETHISDMMTTLKLVEIILQICSTMSQAEATVARSDATGAMCKEFIARNFGPQPNFAGIPHELSSLYNNRTRLSYRKLMSKDPRKLDPEELNPEELNPEELNPEELEAEELDPGRLALNQFARYWKALILNCNIIRKGSSTTKKRIATVMKEIEASVHKSSWPNQEKSHPFPGHLSQEVNSVQPLIFGLLGAVGECCKEIKCDNRLSLAKTEIERDVMVVGTETRKKRIMDGCAGKPGRCYPVNMDTSMKLPIEAKPFTRKSMSFEQLDEESRNQIIGHLSKYGHQGLQVFSLGNSTWVTGVTANPAYIIVYRLIVPMEEYCGDKKPFVKLQIVESFKLPLMTQECFESWIAKCKAAKPQDFTPKVDEEIHRLKVELYGTAEAIKTSVDAHGVPLGIWVLWDLLQRRRIDLFGPDYTELFRSGGNNHVGELLGTGSFGLVFSYKMEGETDANASVVLKVPLLQKCTHLERELEILQHLGREEDPNTTIDEGMALPVVMKVLHDIPVVLGGVKQQLKGLLLRPQGKPLTYCVRRVKELHVLRRRVIQVWSQLEAALKYMHEKNVFHNDVTPKNIVVCDTDWSVCLVDFGSAWHKCGNDKKMTGFEGTPNYAHSDIFKSYPSTAWKHQDGSYDLYALTLTVIVLFNKGQARWDMKPFPASITNKNRNELLDLLEERKKKAIAMIFESGCSKRLQKEWKDHIETERLADLRRPNHDPAAAASGGYASLQVTFQGTEAEAPRHPLTRTGLRSSTKRMGIGTIDHISSRPSSKKRQRNIDQESTVPTTKKQRRR